MHLLVNYIILSQKFAMCILSLFIYQFRLLFFYFSILVLGAVNWYIQKKLYIIYRWERICSAYLLTANIISESTSLSSFTMFNVIFLTFVLKMLIRNELEITSAWSEVFHVCEMFEQLRTVDVYMKHCGFYYCYIFSKII